jgi:hypothetical protein
MRFFRFFPLAGLLLPLPAALPAHAQQTAAKPLPEIPQLMREVEEHQKALEKVQENYTYSSLQTTQDLDSNGRVKKTVVEEREVFFVNGRAIARLVKKDGKPLAGDELDKETKRVTKEVEKAEKPAKPKEGQDLSVSRILAVVEVRNPRRESYRGRPTIIFNMVGRKDAKAHGLEEEVYKKLQGTVWIDEADRQIAHLDVAFDDNFHVAGGLVANIQKGSNFHIDQAPVNGEIWLPDGFEGTAQIRLFLVKGLRQHFTERDYNYQRFRVDAQQGKDAKVVAEKKP